MATFVVRCVRSSHVCFPILTALGYTGGDAADCSSMNALADCDVDAATGNKNLVYGGDF